MNNSTEACSWQVPACV